MCQSFFKALRNGVKRLGFLIYTLKSPMMNILADSNESLMAWILCLKYLDIHQHCHQCEMVDRH